MCNEQNMLYVIMKRGGIYPMKTAEIRRTFLDFFASKGHTIVPSSSLVPANDATLLFTNAGMVQFKDTFLGLEQRSYKRATTAQKCMRVSGKHNDLENVGPSPRHHTFFEMLGNFSFGDYFKREAIQYAWELITQVFQLPVERLWFTVYTDDDDAARLWEEVGADPARILRFGEEENFWSMGDTGPCGPCSEIHYYQGLDVNVQRPEGVNSEDDDYMEFWNLVFMQYERDAQGNMTPLPRPSIDTGLGLERIAAILQGVKNNYVTDLMGGHYTELRNKRDYIKEVITFEEERFSRTLSIGLHHLEDTFLSRIVGEDTKILPGRDAFMLYDTYGFPLDLTQKILAERGMSVDVEGYEEALREQQERSRLASHFKRGGEAERWSARGLPATIFTGYKELQTRARILAL